MQPNKDKQKQQQQGGAGPEQRNGGGGDPTQSTHYVGSGRSIPIMQVCLGAAAAASMGAKDGQNVGSGV